MWANTKPGLFFFARQDMSAAVRKIKPFCFIGALVDEVPSAVFHKSTKCQSPPDPLVNGDYEIPLPLDLNFTGGGWGGSVA